MSPHHPQPPLCPHREIAPELKLTCYRRNPNLFFKPRELPRLALEVLKDVGEPLWSRVIVLRILARKREELPAPELRRLPSTGYRQSCRSCRRGA